VAAHTRRVTRDPRMPTGNLPRPPGAWAKVRPSRGPVRAASPKLRPARKGVHGRDQREVGGEVRGALGAVDVHDVVLQGLLDEVQHARAELWQYTPERHAVVGQADLPQAWSLLSSH